MIMKNMISLSLMKVSERDDVNDMRGGWCYGFFFFFFNIIKFSKGIMVNT